MIKKSLPKQFCIFSRIIEKMQIFVKKPEGNTTTLNVESNETICSIKRKLKEKEGIRSDMHLVLTTYDGTLLEDRHTLAHYDVLKDSTLRYALADKPCTLFIETWNRELVILELNFEDSIDYVKAKIQEQEGIPSHKQLLFDYGKLLEDGSRTLADYHIPNQGFLYLAIQHEQGHQSAAATQRQTKRARPATPTKATSIEMQIYVKKPDGNTTTLNVESNEKICSIKRKLKEKEGMRSDMHLTTSDGTLLFDGHTLADYDVLTESTLRLLLNQGPLAFAEVWVLNVETWSGVRFTSYAASHHTIDDVKAKIDDKEGIPSHKQLLSYRGKLLEDGTRTLAQYRIPNHSRLKLAIQGHQSAAATSKVAQRQTKRARPETPTKATSISETICRMEAELKKNKEELTIARNKEKELEAIISGLKAKSKKNEEIARNKEKELEATISRLKAENRKIEEELTIVRNNEKELEASISNKKTEEDS